MESPPKLNHDSKEVFAAKGRLKGRVVRMST